jgi:hypothetical protein
MGVVTTKSKVITNRDAGTLSNSNIAKGNVLEALGVVSAVSGDSIGSKYIFAQVPSNARMSEVLVTAPDIGTTTAADIGLYDTTANGGAVVDADFFTAAFVLNAGAVANSNVAHGNVITLANSEKMLWELLGLTSDPCKHYDIAATLTGAADAAGAIHMKARFTV